MPTVVLLVLVMWLLGACGAPAEEITTVLGTGVRGFLGDGGPAKEAQLALPSGITVDAGGTLYVGDQANGRLRAMSPEGIVRTVAPRVVITPGALAADRDGALYVAVSSRVVRVRVTDGTVTVVAGTSIPGFSGDGGPGTRAQIQTPGGLALDRHGNLFIADIFNHRVRELSRDGTIATIAGTGIPGFSGDGGAATAAQLNQPSGLARLGDDLYISDTNNHRVRKISRDGTITTVAGTGEPGVYGDGGPATEAQLNGPGGLAAGAGGLVVADRNNNRVRVIRKDGTIATVAGNGGPGSVERGGPAPGDGGPAIDAELDPEEVTVDSYGRLYISEYFNHRVRRITLGGP